MWNKIKKYLKPFCSWKFLISFGGAWFITNGWSYVFVIVGPLCHIDWMTTIGVSYQAFLWLPFTPEKLITIPLAIFFHTKIFKNDEKTKLQLEEMYTEAKLDWQRFKNKFKKNKDKV